jgi:hypothetical protein
MILEIPAVAKSIRAILGFVPPAELPGRCACWRHRRATTPIGGRFSRAAPGQTYSERRAAENAEWFGEL